MKKKVMIATSAIVILGASAAAYLNYAANTKAEEAIKTQLSTKMPIVDVKVKNVKCSNFGDTCELSGIASSDVNIKKMTINGTVDIAYIFADKIKPGSYKTEVILEGIDPADKTFSDLIASSPFGKNFLSQKRLKDLQGQSPTIKTKLDLDVTKEKSILSTATSLSLKNLPAKLDSKVIVTLKEDMALVGEDPLGILAAMSKLFINEATINFEHDDELLLEAFYADYDKSSQRIKSKNGWSRLNKKWIRKNNLTQKLTKDEFYNEMIGLVANKDGGKIKNEIKSISKLTGLSEKHVIETLQKLVSKGDSLEISIKSKNGIPVNAFITTKADKYIAGLIKKKEVTVEVN